MVDDGLQRDGHVANVDGLHSGRPGHRERRECSGSATHGRSTARVCRAADLQLQLLDSSGEATAASDFRITAQSTGWRRNGAPRGATELDASEGGARTSSHCRFNYSVPEIAQGVKIGGKCPRMYRLDGAVKSGDQKCATTSTWIETVQL